MSFFHYISHFLFKKNSLIDILPTVRGTYKENVPLANMTWLGVGGPAEVLFEPADENDLLYFIELKKNIPVTIIGGGSNLLIRDGGIPGVVIRLGKNFETIDIKEDGTITCAAGAKNTEISRKAMEAGISGFEFLCDIPGTIGGAVRMNAGAFGSSIADYLVKLEGIDPANGVHITLTRDEVPMGYRENDLPLGWVFTKVILKGTPEDKIKIQEKMNAYKKQRRETQPHGVRTAGSMFKNPIGLKAWQLIEKSGCRGLRVGDAIVSEKHSNFFVNIGNATAMDFEELINLVRNRVLENCGIQLELEVRCLGVKTKAFSSFGGK